MRTSKAEIVILSDLNHVTFKVRKLSEESFIEVPVSLARAFSFYQVLAGRKKSEAVKRTEGDRSLFLAVFVDRKSSEEEVNNDGGEGRSEKEGGEKGEDFLIIHAREEKAGEGRKFGYSVGVPGRLLLANEVRRAISSVLRNGGFLEVGKGDLAVLVLGGSMRVVLKGDMIKLSGKTVAILKNAFLLGKDVDLGEVVVRGSTMTVRGVQLPQEQGALLRGVVEVFPEER